MGKHKFSYALFAHEDGLHKGGVIDESYKLNVPLIVYHSSCVASPSSLEGKTSYFSTDAPGVVIETVKKAEDSPNLIVRY